MDGAVGPYNNAFNGRGRAWAALPRSPAVTLCSVPPSRCPARVMRGPLAVHMKYIYALVAGIVSAAIAAFASAVVLGITNIYLSGHGITWPSKEFNWCFISMSLLDLIMISVSLLVLEPIRKT